jgi:hypothetical protein
VNNFQFTRNANGTVNAGNFDALQSIEHEIDEVLGLGSVLNFSQFPNDASGVTADRLEDLFRYSAPATRSLTQNANATSYFSINGGTTNIIGFNQRAGGDYGDWFNGNANGGCNPLPNPPRVQFAFSCPGQTSDVSATSPEGIALDVIGAGAGARHVRAARHLAARSRRAAPAAALAAFPSVPACSVGIPFKLKELRTLQRLTATGAGEAGAAPGIRTFFQSICGSLHRLQPHERTR